MANPPTYAQCWDALKAAIWVIHQDFLSLKGNAVQYTDLEVAYLATLADFDLPYRQAAEQRLRDYRARRLNNLGTSRALLDPLIAQFSRVINCRERDPASVIRRLYQYMVDLSPDDTVVSDGSSFGSASSITGTGNPGIVRCTVDRYGYALETGCFTETKTFKVARDQAGGVAAGSEEIEWTGDNPGLDLLAEDGSGLAGRIPVDSANTGSSLLQNSSFGTFSGTAAVPTDIAGWTPASSISNFLLNGSTYYRQADYETTPYALQFAASDTLSQAFSVTGAAVSDADDQPYVLSFRWNRNGTTCTLTGHMGASSQAVSVVAQSGWQHFYMDMDADLYLKNWVEDAPDVKIQVASLSATGFLVDDLYFGPMRRIGPRGRHTWMNVFAGSTNLLYGSYFTTADVRSRTGIIQRWLIDLYNLYLPHAASGSNTILDPT